ncbi:MAG: peptidyl-prolyl cis-trans isomerase [Armatimonadota bacterium]|nr:peptidyl-prolyl cis-trans isomerase [bacterium]MDW8104999.1 peptidyl-prolyl cis-trans isomerase [Armatimonadota bacterium]MDW8289081.1 peptidyl-prolyl cis-trans isomerase [Armatimonadota bacterium]
MNKKKVETWRWLLGMALSMAVLLVSAGCGGKNVGRVNDKPISQAEYHKVLERMAVPIVGQNDVPLVDPVTGRIVRDQAGYLALRMLVDRRIVLEMAEKEKVMPTEQEIERELERQKKQPDFNERLKALGYTQDDLKEDIKVELAAFKLITKGITVTEEEIRKEYNRRIQQFTIPAQVQVALILVDNRKKLDEIQSQIKKGVDFLVLAGQYRPPDMPPTMNTTSVWLQENNEMFRQLPQLWQTLQKTPVGSVTPPQPIRWQSAPGKVVNGWILFKVLEKKERQVRPLDDEVREDLRRLLMQMKSKRDLGRELVQMRTQAKVTFEIPRYNRRWEQDVQQWKQIAQTGTPAPTPAMPTPSTGGGSP